MASNVEYFATQAAQLSVSDFAKKLSALGVLVRLDERGGVDEPAPWAFHNADHIPQHSPEKRRSPRDDDKVDTEALRKALAGDAARAPGDHAGDDASSPNMGEGPDPHLFDDDDVDANSETVTRTFDGDIQLPIPPARGAASVIPISVGETRVLGRDNACDVVIAERSISKEHAEILTSEDGTFAIVDKGSANGTKINSRRLKAGNKTPLRPGDVVFFGDVMFLFLSPELLHQHVSSFMD